MYAAEMGHDRIVCLLIPFSEVDKREPQLQRTALMLAAANGHTRCVRALVQGGADIRLVDGDGKTAAGYAVAYGHGSNRLMMQNLWVTPANFEDHRRALVSNLQMAPGHRGDRYRNLRHFAPRRLFDQNSTMTMGRSLRKSMDPY